MRFPHLSTMTFDEKFFVPGRGGCPVYCLASLAAAQMLVMGTIYYPSCDHLSDIQRCLQHCHMSGRVQNHSWLRSTELEIK